MLKHTLAAALVALAVPALPAMAQDAGTVVATVNGDQITLGQLLVMRRAIEAQGQTLPADAATWTMLLDQLVDQAAVATANEDKIDAGDRASLEVQRRAYLASTALDDLAEAEPTDEELNAAYQKFFGGAEPKTEYSAAHVLVETEEQAKAVKAELDAGADFGTVAEQRSTGPSGPNKGDLGWFTADQMVPPFAEAVKALEKGQISDPVQTELGWHIIKLNDTREVQPPKLDEVRDQLIVQVRRDKVQAEVQRLREAAKIERSEGLDPALLDKAELLDAR